MNSSLTFAGFVGQLTALFNAVIGLLIGVAIAVFFIGIIRYLWGSADAKNHQSGRELMMWGLVAMFVLMSLWGILAFFKGAIFP